MQSMLFDKLKMAAVVLSGLFLLGFGALVAAQQVAGKGATGRPRDTAIAERNDSPSTLRLVGTTEYDPATVTVVRTPFDSRVDKVLVDLGSTVKTGDPLLELFSTDLAEAKSNYEAATSQWVHDKKVLDYKTPLAMANMLPRKELIEVENDEAQSRLKMKLAKDKLLVYGLTEKEIENAKKEDGVQKAKMILRSRAGGVVVQRSVVRGITTPRGRADDHRASRPSLGTGKRQRARRRESQVGAEAESDFPFAPIERSTPR